ncbi:hypothetical protein [Intrasporangium sp.]|uniref:hypothetical protein n=1 Tax=Intrasporangium sp. TaxID=1925024 RepID=UPI003221AFE0
MVSMPDTATLLTVRVLGLLAALNGLDHGVGAITQGPGSPPNRLFQSWANVDAFDPLGGEPALTLIPDLLVSGLLAVLTAITLGAWATVCPERRHSGLVIVGLSLLLLLVGGGFGPPLLGIVVGLLAMRIGSMTSRPVGPVTRLAARLCPWPLVVAALCFLGLVPGTMLLYVVGIDSGGLVMVLIVAAFAATALAVWSARATDRAVVSLPSSVGTAHPSGLPDRQDCPTLRRSRR